MGGINSNVDMRTLLGSKAPTCIFGIDVFHGSTGDTGKPSIAAVVASVEDNKWSRYAPQVSEQEANQEVIKDLCKKNGDGMVVDLLKEFHGHHKRHPGQIIVYRDGVSESQFETVGTTELNQFKEACKVVDQRNGDNIPIAFIIVQKRHHTRFFKRSQDNEGFENMQPGTAVTSEVCQTQNYLRSNRSFITEPDRSPGVTSRPAHYTVFRDEIKLGQPKIRELTNYLCYCFGRATTAESIPAPLYYAHVAAKHYSSFADKDAAANEPKLRKIRSMQKIHNNLMKAEYRMFYI